MSTNNTTIIVLDCPQLSSDAIGTANSVLLFFLMFGLGVTIEFEEFKHHFKKPTPLIIGMLSHFLIMPAIGYGIATAPNIPLPYAVGLVAMTCAPGGSLSNVLAMVFRADMNLSVAMTTASSIIAIGMLPLNLYIYLHLTGLASDLCLSVGGLALTAAIVAVGTLAGLFITPYISLKSLERIALLGALSGFGIVIIGFVENAQSGIPIWACPPRVAGLIFIPVLVGCVWGVGVGILARLPKAQCVAIGLETSIQNKFVGAAVIALLFTGQTRDQAFAVPIVYAALAFAFNIVWCLFAWKILGWTNLPKNASLLDSIKMVREGIKDKKRKADEANKVAGEETVVVKQDGV